MIVPLHVTIQRCASILDAIAGIMLLLLKQNSFYQGNNNGRFGFLLDVTD
jgi:hypothetical protein